MTLVMLSSPQHEISTANKTEILKINLPCFQTLRCVFIMLINVKMPTTVGILIFISMINFMLSSVEHEKSSKTLRPGNIRLFVEVSTALIAPTHSVNQSYLQRGFNSIPLYRHLKSFFDLPQLKKNSKTFV